MSNRKPKDPNAPKRPMSSYFIFMNERRPMLRQTHSNKPMTEITKLIAQEWKNLSLPVKTKYIEKAAQLKEKYKITLEEYNRSSAAKNFEKKLNSQPNTNNQKTSTRNNSNRRVRKKKIFDISDESVQYATPITQSRATNNSFSWIPCNNNNNNTSNLNNNNNTSLPYGINSWNFRNINDNNNNTNRISSTISSPNTNNNNNNTWSFRNNSASDANNNNNNSGSWNASANVNNNTGLIWGFGPGNDNKSNNNTQQTISKTLENMGFQVVDIEKAIKIWEGNGNDSYDIVAITEIIVALQRKDESTKVIIASPCDKDSLENSNSNNNDVMEYKEENERLKDEIKRLQKRLDLFECNCEQMDRMNLDELNELKTRIQNEMQNKIKMIDDAQKKIMDNTYKCVACMDNSKNISFDGCSHIALCDKCETCMQPKRCPICQTPYKTAKKINF